MADKPDFRLPFQDLTNLVPQNLRNEAISALLDNLFNRFMTHDESIPLHGYIGKAPPTVDDKTPRVAETSVERDINAVIPVMNFKQGAETVAFTVQDIINKVRALGVSREGLQWLYSQGNNYVPPINIDKFTNFFNYYWVAKALESKPELSWNPELLPEYYTIGRPLPGDLRKTNVVVATTKPIVLTGAGFEKLKFNLEFTSPTTFTILPVGSLGSYNPQTIEFALSSDDDKFDYNVVGPDGIFKLFEFSVTRETIYDQNGNIAGSASFETGDRFLIDITFLSRNYTVTFFGSTGVKGKITKVRALNEFQKVDGVTLQAGDRVLVKDAPPDQAGIYVVTRGNWEKAEDFNADTAAVGATVYVRKGDVNGGKTFKSIQANGGYGWAQDTTATFSNTSDWEEGNFWMSSDELTRLGINRSDAVQAVRPIIEYDGSLELNHHVQNGKPAASGEMYRQVKMEFNQLPLFNLYRYDGTHAGLVSSVFYYEEDMTARLDVQLQKRVKKSTNSSADFIFNHGMADEAGQLLFVKQNETLRTVWRPGYSHATAVDVTNLGDSDGVISNVVVDEFSQQQVWTLTAISDSAFKVTSSKTPELPVQYATAYAGVPYSNKDISFTINLGTVPFVAGDQYIIRVGNFESSRYVHRTENGAIYDFHGKEEADTEKVGTWQLPRTFSNNPYNESRSPLPEGSLFSHFRGILANQVEGRPINYGFGGNIKLWSEPHTLLAALLMQRDMTPISIIDLAQRQYETALNSLRDIFQQNIVQYLGDHGPITSVAELDKLLNALLVIRAGDNDVKTVLFDSTSPVIGFPATLPQLGISELVKPGIGYDQVLDRILLTHHDGHLSPLFTDTAEFRQSVFGELITVQIRRADGKYTPGLTFSKDAPTEPYLGELWSTPTGQMAIYDGAQWIAIDLADLLTSLILRVENRLYEGINENSRKVDFTPLEYDPEYMRQLQRELHSFAAVNGYDPLGSNYEASNAFTWNYSQSPLSSFAVIDESKVPARWHDALKAHQRAIPGVIPTERPNLEPWKLFGYETDEEWWSSLTGEQRQSYYSDALEADISYYSLVEQVVLVKLSNTDTMLQGHQLIDGVMTEEGQHVLLQNEPDITKNGIWVASALAWQKTDTVYVPRSYITVSGGTYKNTAWTLVVDHPETGTIFKQIRTWSNKLWEDLQALQPDLKLSVDTIRDELLPPYVSPSHQMAAHALTNVIPQGASAPYEFGQNSPVEEVWKKSLEYGYSKARALFRYDPLLFLRSCWGFNWVTIDAIEYDSFDMQMPGHRRFKLHGEPVDLVNREPMPVTGSGEPMVARYDAYDDQRRQNFSVWRGGVVIGNARVGLQSTIGGFTFTIKDQGFPFRPGDRFEISDNGVIFVPITTHRILGFGQTFTHALRETSIDTQSSYAISAFREWDVNMGYRAGGLVSTNDLTVLTDNDTLGESAYRLIFKKNQIARDEWVQALRVSALELGTVEQNGETSFFDFSKMVFRIEGFNPRYFQFTYNVLGGELQSFKPLNEDNNGIWYFGTSVVDTITTQLPITVTGLQNVVDILFGYASYLESRGWEFNKPSEFNIDAETGRTRNYQLEVEKLIDRCYRGVELGQGHIINPFIDRAWYNQETGLLSEFIDSSLFDVTGHPGVFDALGVKYKKEDLDVIRTNRQSSFGATGPMFSAHVQLDEFEHLFIFNNFAQQSTKSNVLYDPFSGSKVVTYKFKGRKQATKYMRPEFGGHYLVGHEVRRNLQASTDDISDFYNANIAFENETTTRHSLSLLGFNTKKYFDDLDITNKAQFNFWRGLVQSKGTTTSVMAYLNNNRFDDAKIDEFWAYKVAEYGDARQKSFPELKIGVDDAVTQFTQLQFDTIPYADSEESPELTNFIQIDRFDESRWFSIDDLNQDAYFRAEIVGVFELPNPVNGRVYKLPFVADYLEPHFSFVQVNATSVIATESSLLKVVGYGPAKPRFNPIKLFNYVDDELVEEIPMWHPAAGVHTPSAMESINIISDFDQAVYDQLRPWGAKEIGRVWFNTSNLFYLPYYDKVIFPNLDERLSRWGTLADFSSIDVYEWIQSPVPPAEYRDLVLEQAGDASIDPSEKATGEVAHQETYLRTRNLFIRPIAWSYSPIPADVDWGPTPPFPGGSTDAGLTIENGTAMLSKGTFAGYGIQPGMRLGAWDNDLYDPKPLSEYIIEDRYTKKLKKADGSDFGPITATGSGSTGGGTTDPGTGDYTPEANYVFTISSTVFTLPTMPIGTTYGNTISVAKYSDQPVFGGSAPTPPTTFTLTEGTHYTRNGNTFTLTSPTYNGLNIVGGSGTIKYRAPYTGSMGFTIGAKQFYLNGIPAGSTPANQMTVVKTVSSFGMVGSEPTTYTFVLNEGTHYTRSNLLITFANTVINDVNIIGGTGTISYTKTGSVAAPAPAPAPSPGNTVTVAGGISAVVTVEATSYQDNISGQLVFTKIQDVMVPVASDDEGYVISWSVDPAFKVTESSGGNSEQVVVNTALSTDQGTPKIPATPGSPATTGTLLLRMGGSVSSSSETGFVKSTYKKDANGDILRGPSIPQYEVDPNTGAFVLDENGNKKPLLDENGKPIVKLGDPIIDVQAPSVSATFSVDGASFTVTANGDNADTLGKLVDRMNAASGRAPFSISGSGIVGRSPSAGAGSSVRVVSGGSLLAALKNYGGAEEVQGTAAVAATPEIPRKPPTSYLYGAKVTVSAGEVITVELPKFGLTVNLEVTASGTYPADAIRNTIVGALSNLLFVKDAIVITPVVEGPYYDLSNDLQDADDSPGWRVWTVPTQEELDGDGVPPFSSWKPYQGDLVRIPGTLIQIQDAVAYNSEPLTLKDGNVIHRYGSIWNEWQMLRNLIMTYPRADSSSAYSVERVGNAVTFTTVENIDPIATTVYVNGIAQLKVQFNINGKILTVANIKASDEVIVIVRKYEPTAAELAFDPDVAEDYSIQQQYRQNYNFVSVPQRDSEGQLTSSLYYFWVKNKTTPAVGKRQSIQSIAQELRSGPPNYITFQNYRDAQTYAGVSYPRRYDAITVSGLSYIVTKDNTFKLRFTRNFTLRDEPEDLNLKNVHTEWSLMRPGQRGRVPDTLWQKLTDSVAGEDSAGNVIPAARRVLYDERNNTRTRFGFRPEQTLAPAELLRLSIIHTILNTRLTIASASGVLVPDYIEFLNPDDSDEWFKDATAARKTMADIWNNAKTEQINEIFFAALNDVLENNYEMTDIFKTSRLSAYSIKVVRAQPVPQTYE